MYIYVHVHEAYIYPRVKFLNAYTHHIHTHIRHIRILIDVTLYLTHIYTHVNTLHVHAYMICTHIHVACVHGTLYSRLPRDRTRNKQKYRVTVRCVVLQRDALCCSVLQSVCLHFFWGGNLI